MIKVGIVGVHPDRGWAALAHIPALQQLPEFELTAVSHHSLEVAEAAAKKLGAARAFAHVRDLVDVVDLVVVTANVTQHRPLIEAAIDGGKAVLSEWPLGVDLPQAMALRDRARSAGVLAAIGLQTRAAPVVDFIGERIRDGYFGRVRSSSLIASGIYWGDTMPDSTAYTLDPANGASMVDVVLAHSLDALLTALKGSFRSLEATAANVRATTRLVESGREVPLVVPDQVAVSGVLDTGVFVNAHFRGGLSRATNFRWEVNGSEGDVVVTSPVGYTGLGGFRIEEARGDETLHETTLPARFAGGLSEGLAQSVALAYRRLASDLTRGTKLAPTFDDAVKLHELVAQVKR